MKQNLIRNVKYLKFLGCDCGVKIIHKPLPTCQDKAINYTIAFVTHTCNHLGWGEALTGSGCIRATSKKWAQQSLTVISLLMTMCKFWYNHEVLTLESMILSPLQLDMVLSYHSNRHGVTWIRSQVLKFENHWTKHASSGSSLTYIHFLLRTITPVSCHSCKTALEDKVLFHIIQYYW